MRISTLEFRPAEHPVLGASYLGRGRTRFCVWAPLAENVSVMLAGPQERLVPLHRRGRGYHTGETDGVWPGQRYLYILDGAKERPDPASRFQPEGVHGPSEVVGLEQGWSDSSWSGISWRNLVFYELHIGTFTPEGTFDAVIPHLDSLQGLGVTAIELMPVAQFSGERNWGYDGVYPYAVQHSYGGPGGLCRLVDACHRRGMAVFLDVVYNHLGPEGNYLADFGPYFTDRYRTPWGMAVNFDGPDSDEVRHFFIHNALYWTRVFHIDGLRLDAVHAIHDRRALPFLQELGSAVQSEGERLGRRVFVVAESDLNDARLVEPRERLGYGLDGQWNDDFHHALHALLTGERDGYYGDFGDLQHLVRAFRRGYVYTGQYSGYRQRSHGFRPPSAPNKLVVFSQNHDQVGNRALGERLTTLLPFDGLKLAAGAVILSPFVPLLFMGEEYGETVPFLYFTSHSDPELAKAVRRGRRLEFAEFQAREEIPDPQDEATFQRSKIDLERKNHGTHRVLFTLYKELLGIRQRLPVLTDPDGEMETWHKDGEQVLLVHRWNRDHEVALILSFNKRAVEVKLPLAAGEWRKVFDAGEECWLGRGASVPETIVSSGEVGVNLDSRACLLLQRCKEG